jgi:4-hydroxybenzoate polyprenyltransferase
MNQAKATSPVAFTQTVIRYLELIRFSHTLFALPFAMLATVWALILPVSSTQKGAPEFVELRWIAMLGIVLCMVAARSFAMAVNRLLDEKWDGQNPRTANRHLPSKLLSRRGVIRFCIWCAVVFVVCCTLFLPNVLPLILSIPVLMFLAGYSLAKRFTHWVHLWLGTALMLAPICAWIALRGEIVWQNPLDLIPAAMLGFAVMLWVTGFDIVYACQDVGFDRDAKLYSIPAKFGIKTSMRIAAVCHAAMWCVALSLSLWLPELSLGWMFRAMLGVVAILLVAEHWVVSERSLAKIQLAFFQLNSIISVLFLVVGGLDAYLR